MLPTAEWLETAFIQGRLYAVLLRQPVTNLFECIDETFIWSMLAKALAERGHVGMQKAFDPEACGSRPRTGRPWTSITSGWPRTWV
ncbi:MAG: hypothetical protein V8S24_13085 [Gordonibacter pamelaeae]